MIDLQLCDITIDYKLFDIMFQLHRNLVQPIDINFYVYLEIILSFTFFFIWSLPYQSLYHR